MQFSPDSKKIMPINSVNILVHATEIPISEKKFSRVKNLMNKYGSQDHNESLSKTESQNKIDDFFGKSSVCSDLTQTNEELSRVPNGEVCVLSDDSSIEVSDDEDLYSNYYGEKLVLDTHGALWDVFRRQDVPKLVEYLRKYSNELKESHSSPEKVSSFINIFNTIFQIDRVVHPVLDESFYLDAFHKRKLKEEFDVEPWTFEQHIGEAVFIPAGCPYQVKKIKSCVNLVLEFISPESASECFKLSEELRRLPMNHKAKGKMLSVVLVILGFSFRMDFLKADLQRCQFNKVAMTVLYSQFLVPHGFLKTEFQIKLPENTKESDCGPVASRKNVE
ncbi:JmjC domain-containing protein [Cynara cardunculus var. scolymus]|uniref:JmjC domain-containing protein n=1 Tax=Cynara cardunculus var. scolymus TaxID=59895 RepID=A0A103Y204_CYNCS|nr:JmjC domain-containing protein [Cynara cardunculus var. scolymus]